MGYTQSSHDYSLFFKISVDSFIAIISYVDDLLLIGNDVNEITFIKS